MNFAHTLRVARAEKNLTQQQLAFIVDVSQVTLSHIENGVVRPYQSTKKKIEDVLGKIDWERTFSEGLVYRRTISN